MTVFSYIKHTEKLLKKIKKEKENKDKIILNVYHFYNYVF